MMMDQRITKKRRRMMTNNHHQPPLVHHSSAAECYGNEESTTTRTRTRWIRIVMDGKIMDDVSLPYTTDHDFTPGLLYKKSRTTMTTKRIRIVVDGKIMNNASLPYFTTTPIRRISSRSYKVGERNTTLWNDRYHELSEYARQHNGDTNVPKKSTTSQALGTWVSTQRTQYKHFRSNERSSITYERIELLNRIGFQWHPRGTETVSWEDRREQLAKYLRQNGDAHVPKIYSKNQPLANWVFTQRKQYKLFKANKRSYITEERCNSLDELGFQCQLPTLSWEDRRQQLADYVNEHGNAKVPGMYSKNKELGTWVAHQRVYYKLFMANKKSSMTTYKVNSLNKLGFQWVLRNRRSNAKRSSSLLISSSSSNSNSDLDLDTDYYRFFAQRNE